MLDQAARRYLRVPFRHQGRNPARGIDCIGLLVLAAHDAGLDLGAHDRRNYGRDPAHRLLDERLQAAFGAPRATADLQPGDVVALRYAGRAMRHVGIVGEREGRLSLIHTDSQHGRVVEHDLLPDHRRHILGVYRLERGA